MTNRTVQALFIEPIYPI